MIGVAVLGGATTGELAFSLVPVLALTGLSALLAVGSLRLLRRSDRRLLVRASVAQLVGLGRVL